MDGLPFEIVAERPIAQHFEECVMVGIEADVLEIVVFATCPNAFLGISRARVAFGRGSGPAGDVGLTVPEEDWHKLIHARVGEQESGRSGQQRSGGHDGVILLGEVIEERLANLGRGHGRAVPEQGRTDRGKV